MEVIWAAIIFIGVLIGLLYWGSTYAGRREKTSNWLGFVYSILGGCSWISFLVLLFLENAGSSSNLQFSALLFSFVAIIAFSFLTGREYPSIAKWWDSFNAKVEKESKKHEAAWGIISLLVVGYFGITAFVGWNARLVKKPSQINIADGYIELVESRSPFGSWFNQDKLRFNGEGLVFIGKTLFFESSTTIPYSKVEELTVKDGQVWNLLKCSVKGRWFNSTRKVYFTSDLTLFDLKKISSRLQKHNIVTEENVSIGRGMFMLFNPKAND